MWRLAGRITETGVTVANVTMVITMNAGRDKNTLVTSMHGRGKAMLI